MSRAFDHVLIIMFENEYRSYVMANPYMRWLARQGIDMANYHGAMHPSQPNYVASVAGQLCGVTNDDDPRASGSGATPSARCLVDLMQPRDRPAKISWKAYMEDYPGTLTWVDAPPYYTKHNPFYLFDSVHNDPARVARIVDAGELLRDIEAGCMPNYAWLTPNIWHDGHYLRGTTSSPNIRYLLVNQVAAWLEHELFGPAGLNFPGPHSKLPPRTLVVVTFDEADYESNPGGTYYEGPNQIYTVLLGDLDAIVPGTVIREGYNHYSLLRTIEDNFELGTLGTNDAAAGPLRFLQGQQFAWQAPDNIAPPKQQHQPNGQFTPVATTTGVALGTYAERAYMISQGDGSDELPYWSSFDGASWTAQTPIDGLDSLSGPMAVAGCTDALVLVYFADNQLSFMTYQSASGWSSPAPVPNAGAITGALALASFADDTQLMLVLNTTAGLSSMIYADGAWAEPVAISAVSAAGQSPSSNLALAELGNLLLLVYQAADGKLTGLTYSLADYNTVRFADGVTQFPSPAQIWSVNPTPLSYLPGTPELPDPVTFSTTGALAMAHLDGGLYLSWAEPERAPKDDPFGQFYPSDWVHWSCYSLAGVLTSQQPASAKSGYGTLGEASWGPRHRLTGAPLRTGTGTLAMTRLGDRLLLAFGPADAELDGQTPNNSIFMSTGGLERRREPLERGC